MLSTASISLYYSLIYSNIYYGLTVWGNLSRITCNKLGTILQKAQQLLQKPFKKRFD